MSQVHANFQLSESGLVISVNNPFIGVSPDGIANCDCCGKDTVEIKYPFCVREFTIEEGLHKIRDSVQSQIYVFGYGYGDFVVWTEKYINIERILPDTDFWKNILQKTKIFFKKSISPELVGKFNTRANCPMSNDSREKKVKVYLENHKW